jgi:glycosyltransferase involved in cell wall biosynthesis
MEALAAGLPAVCLDTSGARSVMREEFGALVEPSGLRAAIARLLSAGGGLKQMSTAAQDFARSQRFSDRAADLADLIASRQ